MTTPAEPPPTEPYEVIVYGELRVKQAHAAVVQQLQDLGYDAQVIDRGDHVVYRHDAPWKGEVVLHDDGWMQVKRQPLRVEGREVPWAKRNTPLAWVGCLIWPWACLRTSGALESQNRWREIEDASVEGLDGKVRQWSDRIADLSTQKTVDSLPERLEALWTQGRPLDGGPVLATAAERRRALHAFWASRTETEWGREVQAAVEAFCRAVVQTSDHPFTDQELAELYPFLAVRTEPEP